MLGKVLTGKALVPSESEASFLPLLPVLRLLMVAPGRIASTQILDLMFEGLAQQGAIEYLAVYDNESSSEEQHKAVVDADVVFFLRSFHRRSLDLLRFAKQHRKIVIYSTDDDFLRLDPETPLGRLHHEPQARQAYESLIAEADLVWLFTEEMRRRYASLAKEVVIGRLPSFVEINGSRHASSLAASDATLVIGYGGSSTHERDLRVVVRPLLDVLDSYPHVRVHFVNYVPKELTGHPRVEMYPFVGSLRAYYEFLRQKRWSIGLAPLEASPFNGGKTSNKYREYAGFGIPGIYSNVPVYAECVRHGDTGYLASHDEAGFTEALRAMIESPALRAEIRIGALRDASSTYSLLGAQLHFLREVSRLAISSRHREWRPPSLLVVGYATTSSMQIGALQPFRRLERDGLLRFRHAEPDRLREGLLDSTDAVLVMRAFEPGTLPLLDWARTRRVPLISAWDDDLLEIMPGTPIGDHHRHPSMVRATQVFLRESSLVLASTPPLYARSREYNDQVMGAAYGLDAESLAAIAADAPGAAPVTGGVTRIGFFGSNDALAEPWMLDALVALRRRYGARVELEAIGVDPKPELRAVLDWWKSDKLEYEQSLQLLRQRGWAIGLAPLADSIFNSAKQATKFRDYAWAGVAMICSRVPAYERSLIDGVHCIFAENTPDAWRDAVACLIDDPSRAAVLRHGARQLLEAVHVQGLTNSAWLQLLWRIGATRDAPPPGTDHRAAKRRKEGQAWSERETDFVRARRGRGDGQHIVELVGREPAQYVPLTRRRRYRVVSTRQSLVGIEICVGSISDTSRAGLSFALCLPSGQVMRQGVVDLSGLPSSSWARLEFPELRNALQQEFLLLVNAEQTSPGEVGIFESSQVASRGLARIACRLGLAPPEATPFLRFLYSPQRAITGEAEVAESMAPPRYEISDRAPAH